MVHHCLVQFSQWLVRKNLPLEEVGHLQWYKDYLVLGDDIDIAKSALISDQYVHCCSIFQIIIGKLKSLHSVKNVFEFANQRFCPQGNISPISVKEELSATSWTGRLEFAKRILSRFGTSCKDKSSALLRKATTPAQWRVLGSELSGMRPQIIVGLTRFCLLPPFLAMPMAEIRIDSLLY